MEFFLYLNMKNKIITISVISFLSIIYWGAVALSQEYVTTIKVRIAFTDLPKNYSVGYSSLQESYVQIKGKGWELAKLSMSSTEDYFVSAQRKPGKHRKELGDFIKYNQWLFPSMQVIQISPSQIEFDVDRVSSKSVRISSNFPIDFRSGFAATSEITIEPSFVEIIGSSVLLNDIDSIKIDNIKFEDIFESVSSTRNLEILPGVNYSENKVTINFEVQKIVDKSFKQIQVVVKNVPEGKELLLYPAKIDIVLRGGINKMGVLTNDSIKVVVDYWDAIKEENGKTEPEILIPKFVRLVSAEPKKLDYIIKQ